MTSCFYPADDVFPADDLFPGCDPENVLAGIEDYLPDWWAKDDPRALLYKLLLAFGASINELSAGIEVVFEDQALLTATLAGLRSEYAYAYGVENEQLPPQVDQLRAYIQTWAGSNGTVDSAIYVLASLLGIDPSEAQGQLRFPVDGTGLHFPADGSGIIFPLAGLLQIDVNYALFTWTVTVAASMLAAYDHDAFVRAVDRLRPAHLLPAVIVET